MTPLGRDFLHLTVYMTAGREVRWVCSTRTFSGEGRRGPRGEAVPLTATAQVPSYLSRAGVE